MRWSAVVVMFYCVGRMLRGVLFGDALQEATQRQRRLIP